MEMLIFANNLCGFMKKADFIEKAMAIHGNKYDYSLIPEEFRGLTESP